VPAARKPLQIGVVGVEDGWSSRRMLAAVAAHTDRHSMIDLGRVALDVAGGRVLFRDEDLAGFDALVVKKLGIRYSPELRERLELLRFLESQGVRIFSRPNSMLRLLDRLSCTLGLRQAGIPMPATVVTEDFEQACAAVERFGTAVLKPLFSSKARGMQVVTAGGDARARVAAFRAAGNPVMYVQRKVALPGQDLGIVFLGGEYLGSYARVAGQASWNTTTPSGGKYRPYRPDESVITLAQRAQAGFELDFTCVDVAETADGPLVFEVSALGGFRGLWEASGVDAAQHYAEYVLRKLGHDGP